MPKKSHDRAEPTKPRAACSVVREENQKPESRGEAIYKNFLDLCRQITRLKSLKEWDVKALDDRVILKKVQDEFLIPVFEIIIDDSLGFAVKVFGCYIPEDHELYLSTKRLVRNFTVSALVDNVARLYKLCSGVQPVGELTKQIFHHVVPMSVDPLIDETSQVFPHKGFWRGKNCSILCNEEQSTCSACQEFDSKEGRATKAKERKLAKPAHIKAPISKTHPDRVKLTLQNQRLRCAELERQLEEMKIEIQKNSVEVGHDLSNDFTSIFSNADKEVTPFMNLFWQQQKKLFTSSGTGVRYHPMLIRFCLSLAAKSPSRYEELRNSGV